MDGWTDGWVARAIRYEVREVVAAMTTTAPTGAFPYIYIIRHARIDNVGKSH